MRSRLLSYVGVLLLAGAGCETSRPIEVTPPREATSLLGEPLFPMALDPEVEATRVEQLDEARAAYEADPADEDRIIWYGRRTAYLGAYRRAIEIFSEGLARLPDSYRLRRHRGHRYITTRRFQDAIDDLGRAAALAANVPDRAEADGLPNRLNIPTSTRHSNIYYHLGLAQYLLADYAAAVDSYRAGMTFSDNDDMRCAMSYWLYLSLRRLGRASEAARAIEFVTPETEVIENTTYLQLLRLYQGALTVEEITGRDSAEWAEIDDATMAYGIAMWHLLAGDAKQAEAGFAEIIAGPAWPAFGHIAAEAEVARPRP